MKGVFFYLLSFIFSIASFAQGGHELKVTVKNIEKQVGTVRICLTNKKSDFLKDCFSSLDIPANSTVVTAVFKNIPAGEYAVAVYHDEDKNGELTKGGMFGIPTEDYGFSNNPNAYFGPPSFEKCTFKVAADKVIVIEL